MRYLFDTAGVAMRIDTLPYARTIARLRDGSNAAVMLVPDAERDSFALRLCQVTTIHGGVLYKKARFQSLTIGGLSGLTVGMQHGNHSLDKLAQVPGLKPHIIESVEQGLNMLKLDRLDATFLSMPGREFVLRANDLAPDDYGWLEVDVSPVVVYVSRKSALARDEAALERLRAVCAGGGQAVMDELMHKYQ